VANPSGIDVDAKDEKGNDALHYLENEYKKGDKEEIKNLLSNYIDRKCIPLINIKNYFYSWASLIGRARRFIIMYLLLCLFHGVE